MICQRKVCINSEDIQIARHQNMNLQAEFANNPFGQPYQFPIPKPEYETYPFSFKLHNVVSYYQEKPINKDEAGDLIINVLYDGLVRACYNPILESKLNIFLNGE